VELLSIEGLTTCEIDNTIQDIIKNIGCTPENYKRLLEDNSSLRKQLYEKGQPENSDCINSIMLKKIKSLEQKNKKYKFFISYQSKSINFKKKKFMQLQTFEFC
jgi:hypothetical protein